MGGFLTCHLQRDDSPRANAQIAQGARPRNPFNQKEPTAFVEMSPFSFFFISASDTKASEFLQDSGASRVRGGAPVLLP